MTSFFHLLPRYLRQKHIERTAQSTTIAIHTPKTPNPIYLPNTIPNMILNIHIDATPTIIVKVTSPAALSTLGTVNDSGQINMADTQVTIISCEASYPVSCDNPYIFMIKGIANIIRTFVNSMAAYTHFSSFFV